MVVGSAQSGCSRGALRPDFDAVFSTSAFLADRAPLTLRYRGVLSATETRGSIVFIGEGCSGDLLDALTGLVGANRICLPCVRMADLGLSTCDASYDEQSESVSDVEIIVSRYDGITFFFLGEHRSVSRVSLVNFDCNASDQSPSKSELSAHRLPIGLSLRILAIPCTHSSAIAMCLLEPQCT